MPKRLLSLDLLEQSENVKKKCRECNEKSNNLIELEGGLENVKQCMKSLIASYNRDQTLFSKDKVNLWENDVIEIFSQYTQLTVDADVIDFAFAGSALSVATEFYAVRVDSLVNDSHNLSSMLRRGFNKPQHHSAAAERNVKNIENVSPPIKRSSRKVIKKRTTTTEPASLNAKLVTMPMISPIFQKLALRIGDLNKPDAMIRNILPANQLNFYDENRKFWNSNDENCFQNSLSPGKIYYTIEGLLSTDILQCKIRSELKFQELDYGDDDVNNKDNDENLADDDDGFDSDENSEENIETNPLSDDCDAFIDSTQLDEARKVDENLENSPHNSQNMKKTQKKIKKIPPKRVTLNDILYMNLNDNIISKLEHAKLVPLTEAINHKNWTSRRLMVKDERSSLINIFETYSFVSLKIDQQEVECEEEIEKFESVYDSGFVDSGLGFTFNETKEFTSLNMEPSTPPPLPFKCEREPIYLIKKAAFEAINDIYRENGEQPARFSEVYRKSFKALDGKTSCALTFFSVLKSATESSINIVKNENINDFLITTS